MLRAQTLFKLGRFADSAAAYASLPASDELSCNLVAALLSAGRAEAALEVVADRRGLASDTYELAYNGGCAAAEKRDWATAMKLLSAARETAQTVLEEAGASEAEKAAELSPIVMQMGFVHQSCGRRDEAARCYGQVVEWKGADKAAAAVAASNLVALQEQGQGLFEALKRLERAKQADSYEALTEEQRESVSANYAAVLLRLHRTEQCNKAVDDLAREFPASSMPVVLRAALLMASNQPDQALAVLKAHPRQDEENVGLATARAHLAAGRPADALQAAVRIRGEWGPAVLGLVLGLAKTRVAGAKDALAEALRHTADQEKKIEVLEASAEVRAAEGDAKGAAEDYRLLLKLDPARPSALIGLVTATSQFDPVAADAVAAGLPTVAGVDQVDVDDLETKLLASGVSGGPAIDVKKSGAGEEKKQAAEKGKEEKGKEEADEEEKKNEAVVDGEKRKRKRTKKKKVRLPKDLDKPIDPERWLPTKQRSYYIAPIKKAVRGKKGRVGGAGGHQGVNVTAEVEASLDAAAKSKASPPPPAKGGQRRKK